MKVLFLANIPSPYRVDFFNEWGKLCDLTVTFEGRDSQERNKKWKADRIVNFKAIFLKGIRTKTDQFFSPGIITFLNRSYDCIIVGGYSTPTSMLAIEVMRIRKIPFWIEADGGLVKQDSVIKYKIKKHFIAAAKGWLSSGQATTDYLVNYGAKPKQVKWYPFTSLWTKDILSRPINAEQKAALRKSLHMEVNKRTILSVGRYIHIKGFDVLLKAIVRCSPEYQFYLVGEDPPKEYQQLSEILKIENVHFIGFKTRDELKTYYQAADLFVLPTRGDVWGLVINEAMANGLPVITTDQCVAGLELVENGVNGYIVPVDNEKKLAEQITKVLQDDSLCEKMVAANIAKIKQYTIENMALTHNEIVKSGGKLTCNKIK